MEWVGGEVVLIGPRIEGGVVRAWLVGRNEEWAVGGEEELTRLTYEVWVDADSDGKLGPDEEVVEFLEAVKTQDWLSIEFQRPIAEILSGLRDGLRHQVTSEFADGMAFIDAGAVPGSSAFRERGSAGPLARGVESRALEARGVRGKGKQEATRPQPTYS